MPELPEVETIRGQLAQYIVGKTIQSINVLDSLLGEYLTVEKVLMSKSLKVNGVERRAKVLLIKLSNGQYLAIHLKMTGRVIYRDEQVTSKSLKISDFDLQELPNKFTRAVIMFTDGSRIYFQDERKFGWIKLLTEKQLETDLLKDPLGPEPLTPQFTQDYFSRMLSANKQQIKVILMDQAKIGGIGNIYANEALYIAKIHPQRKANTLTPDESQKLFDAILKVLKKGLETHGASEDNYRDALGQKGSYHLHFLVYKQNGKPCKNCGTKILRIAIGGRGTFLCPTCQN
ncbi:MAG: bifunctional DNA-formamidopyrimidine glycosylase/DNA-(apurinic or apyrimidinic site) lyase [Patescibacteria group bacterium]|jgi:formamidopyrimidine-DNA glycosylase